MNNVMKKRIDESAKLLAGLFFVIATLFSLRVIIGYLFKPLINERELIVFNYTIAIIYFMVVLFVYGIQRMDFPSVTLQVMK